MNKEVTVFAHRGFSGAAPENTLISFQKALELGVSGIELDVQLSRDGEVMVLHDEKLDRTTDGQGFLVQYSRQELARLDAGKWFSPEFAGIGIPTLAEVLELVRNYPILLNIELKTGIIDYPGLELKVLDLVYRHNLQAQTLYSSFNHYSLKKVRDLDSTARIGVLYVCGIYEPWEYVKNFVAEAIHPIVYGVRPELVTGAHQAGLKVNTFTVDEEADMRRMLKYGVDGIFTNYPDRLLKLLKEI